MRRDVAAELEHDLGVRREPDRRDGALDEPAADVGPERGAGREAGEAVRPERLAPDPEEVAERQRAAARDADDAVRAGGAERIDAARLRDAPIPAGTTTTFRPAKSSRCTRNDGARGPQAQPGGGLRGRGRPVARPGPDRPRVHRQCEQKRRETSPITARTVLTRTGSSKSGRKLSTAAADAQRRSRARRRRARAVAGSAEMTTPCQKTGSELRLTAAATAPTTPAAWTRARP